MALEEKNKTIESQHKTELDHDIELEKNKISKETEEKVDESEQIIVKDQIIKEQLDILIEQQKEHIEDIPISKETEDCQNLELKNSQQNNDENADKIYKIPKVIDEVSQESLEVVHEIIQMIAFQFSKVVFNESEESSEGESSEESQEHTITPQIPPQNSIGPSRKRKSS